MSDFHGDGIGALAATGASLTIWRLSRFGSERADMLVLRGVAVFLLFMAAILLAESVHLWMDIAAKVMTGMALLIAYIGGIPGLRTRIPVGERPRAIFELCLIWASVLVVATFYH